MGRMHPVHSSRDHEEIDPRYHNNDECPYYQELLVGGEVAEGDGNHWLCSWCAEHRA